jgi:hypothetical protein
MTKSEQYRAKAADYEQLGKQTDAASEILELKVLERSYTMMAENEELLQSNETIVQAPPVDRSDDVLATEEERILRYLGAAVIVQWNTIPTKLQRELFDTAGAMGDLLQTDTLRGQIARFLHQHKDDTC